MPQEARQTVAILLDFVHPLGPRNEGHVAGEAACRLRLSSSRQPYQQLTYRPRLPKTNTAGGLDPTFVHRQLIWPDAERLDPVQSIQRIQKLYPGFLDTRSRKFYSTGSIWATPENYSQAQLNELDSSQSDGSPTISET
jgi:hypothetical protein